MGFGLQCAAMREQLLLIGLLLSTIVPLMGQDIDANLSLQNRSPSTVAGQILDLEETVHVDGATLINVISTDVCETRGRQIDSGAHHHSVLDRNVAQMMILHIGS